MGSNKKLEGFDLYSVIISELGWNFNAGDLIFIEDANSDFMIICKR